MESTIKPAESTDDPGEIMVAMMTRRSNVSERSGKFRMADCPRCGESCYVDMPNLHLARNIYPDRMIALCTLCGMSGHMNKKMVPKWLKRKGMTPNEALEQLLASVVIVNGE